MKKVILGMMVATVMSFGNEWDIKKGDDHCTMLTKTAYTIMHARQRNVPMMTLLKIYSEPTAMSDVSTYMVKEVYGQQRFQTKIYQENAQIDYANDWLKICLKAEKKGNK